jgi:hypothetical protein
MISFSQNHEKLDLKLLNVNEKLKLISIICSELGLECFINIDRSDQFEITNSNYTFIININYIIEVLKINLDKFTVSIRLYNRYCYFINDSTNIKKYKKILFNNKKYKEDYYIEWELLNKNDINKNDMNRLLELYNNVNSLLNIMCEEFYKIHEKKNKLNMNLKKWLCADIEDYYNFIKIWTKNNINQFVVKIEILIEYIQENENKKENKNENKSIIYLINFLIYNYNLYKNIILLVSEIIKQWEDYEYLDPPNDINRTKKMIYMENITYLSIVLNIKYNINFNLIGFK